MSVVVTTPADKLGETLFEGMNSSSTGWAGWSESEMTQEATAVRPAIDGDPLAQPGWRARNTGTLTSPNRTLPAGTYEIRWYARPLLGNTKEGTALLNVFDQSVNIGQVSIPFDRSSDLETWVQSSLRFTVSGESDQITLRFDGQFTGRRGEFGFLISSPRFFSITEAADTNHDHDDRTKELIGEANHAAAEHGHDDRTNELIDEKLSNFKAGLDEGEVNQLITAANHAAADHGHDDRTNELIDAKLSNFKAGLDESEVNQLIDGAGHIKTEDAEKLIEEKIAAQAHEIPLSRDLILNREIMPGVTSLVGWSLNKAGDPLAAEAAEDFHDEPITNFDYAKGTIEIVQDRMPVTGLVKTTTGYRSSNGQFCLTRRIGPMPDFIRDIWSLGFYVAIQGTAANPTDQLVITYLTRSSGGSWVSGANTKVDVLVNQWQWVKFDTGVIPDGRQGLRIVGQIGNDKILRVGGVIAWPK